MRKLSSLFASLLLLLFEARHQLGAQGPALEPPLRNQVTLDASILAAGFTYARATSAGNLVGAGAGAGTEFNIRMVHGEKWGQTSAELAHVEMFTRRKMTSRWQYDVGVMAAADIHSQSVHGQSGSEQEFGGFFGGYIAPMWTWRALSVGPRIQTGAYWAPHPAFGVGITPLTARFLFRF